MSTTKKRAAFILSFALTASLLSGCATLERDWKSAESNFSGGLDRTLVSYDQSGNEILNVEGKIDIQENEFGNKVLFELDGKRHVIYNATVVVSEK